MNKKLAIARLDNILNYTENTLDLKNISVDELMSIFELAIDCIKRQIPQEPSTDEAGEVGCPLCNEVVEGDFCPNCGQAIDWGETRREVIFRGKRKDTGEWVYGNLLSGEGKSFIGIIVKGEDGKYISELVEVVHTTVGQHLGLKDVEGKHIFEGDIVMIGYADFPLVVLATWSLRLENSFEVFYVGNVYDNPDLMGSIENL